MAVVKSLSIQSNLDMASDIQNEDDQKTETSFLQKIRLLLRGITLEPLLFCSILPSVMSSLAVQNLNLDKACWVNLHLNDSTCEALKAKDNTGYNITDEIAVQQLVASMSAWKNVIQSLFPSIIILFVGSWSDRHQKRKPCIYLPMFGDLISSIGFIFCTFFFFQLPMEVTAIVEAVPTALVGGWYTLHIGIYSYISSVSDMKNRTLRIGAVTIFSNVSITVGVALSGILFRKLGFYGVFATAITLYLIGLSYTYFNVKEIEKKVVNEDGNVKKGFLVDFFNFKHVMNTLRVVFKKGEKNRRKRMCVIIILVMIIFGPLYGEMSVLYLYTRYKFGWNEVDYSIFSTFTFVLHMMGTIFNLTFFVKYLKVDDALLGIVSNTSKILSCFVFAFAPNPTIFYLGAVVEMFNGTSFIAMRSIVSKLVPPDELGKVISLFGVAECLMPVVYGPLYSITYRLTVGWLPGTFFVLGGLLTLPAAFMFLWLYFEHKRDLVEEKERQSQSLLSKNDEGTKE